jgi:hypothetical protein
MKHLMPIFVAIIAITLFISTIDFKETYQDGWKKGYKSGYCYEIVNCVSPVVPVCPVPKIGFETYQDGHNRGFSTGKRDRHESQ